LQDIWRFSDQHFIRCGLSNIMRTNIDILRALCFTEEDIKTIQNLGDTFTDIEIEFMVEFKKVFELGVEQLKKFIDKLDEEGKDLRTTDIEYYVVHILNSPLSALARELAKDKKYFVIIPDFLAIWGNYNNSRHNTSLYYDDDYPINVIVDVFNKSPDFVQGMVRSSSEVTEKIFRSSVGASIINDNTLPLVDKAQQIRYSEERTGEWVGRSIGTYNVKDSWYWNAMLPVRDKIFDLVKEYIGDEYYRIFQDKKKFYPFNEDSNTSTSSVYELEREIQEGDDPENKEVLLTDLMGNVFDNRASVLKIETPQDKKEYVLNTVKGQYGN